MIGRNTYTPGRGSIRNRGRFRRRMSSGANILLCLCNNINNNSNENISAYNNNKIDTNMYNLKYANVRIKL